MYSSIRGGTIIHKGAPRFHFPTHLVTDAGGLSDMLCMWMEVALSMNSCVVLVLVSPQQNINQVTNHPGFRLQSGAHLRVKFHQNIEQIVKSANDYNGLNYTPGNKLCGRSIHARLIS